MAVKLVYFAWVRERIGKTDEHLDLPEGVRTVGELLAHLKTRGEEYDYAFENARVIRVAIDQVHVKHDSEIAGAREIAFFPPMTGG